MKISTLKLPTGAPSLQQLSLGKFDKGVITLINESSLPPNALKEANNITLVEDGNASPRPGVQWYGSPLPNGAAIDGAQYFTTSAGAVHIVAIGGGNVYRSTNDALTWTLCTGVTLTSGYKVYMVQANMKLYITNGQNPISLYDGTTVLTQYTALTTPTGVSVTATSSLLSSPVYTQYYKVSAVNQIGFTQGSATATVGVNKTRANWDPANTGANFATVSWTAVTGAIRYDIYTADTLADANLGNFYYLDSAPGTSYIDNGQTFENTNSIAPTQNTTTGPLVSELSFVGSRLMGTRDKNNPYRVWYSGDGPFIGYFSDSYNGGYIDLQPGGIYTPVQIEDYRDGKGTPLASVWCSSPDGRGCTFQVTLDQASFLNQTYIQPSAYKLPGSRGTNASNSVVNVLNDYMFFNQQGIYDLGARPNILNVLSTDEYSANIRPTLQTINPVAAKNIAAYYYLAKVYFSVPYGSSSNNATIVYDTERKAWLPNGYTIGFERFFQYADNAGTTHLLAWKPGDTQLTEVANQSVQGDYGVAFQTSLITGQVNTNKSRFDFMFVEQAEFELANLSGTVNVELLGTERNKGFGSQKTASVSPTVINAGWDTLAWDTVPWDYTAIVPQTYSSSSTKKYFNVQRSLNSYQWHIFTNTLTAAYVTRTLQIEGTPDQAGFPRQWLIKAN